ncbi:hypothetical protein ABEF93_008511 [Exophiala dermatitidis]
MADSMNLITAQISFLEPHLALIHVPIELYSLFLQPILRLLFGEDHDEDAGRVSWTSRHDFLNVSITPVECSIMCSRVLADRFVVPVAEALNRLYATSGARNDNDSSSKEANGSHRKTQIHISTEDYIAIQVDGQGLDAGQRVLELTSPLAMAGISIFFITTYFSDYILVPFRQRRTVTKALQQRGFVFSHTADAFVSQLSPSSPALPDGGSGGSGSGRHRTWPSPFYETITSTSTPATPPAKDIPELQMRTFTKLKRNNVTPLVDGAVRLASCAGSREYSLESEDRLKNDLLQVLLATAAVPLRAKEIATGTTAADNTNGDNNAHVESADPDTEESISDYRDSETDFGARFLSLTITSGEPISLLIEHRLLDRLGASLLGAKSVDDALVPITLDLRDLPLEATGIVCGVAGRLAQGDSTGLDGDLHEKELSPGSGSGSSRTDDGEVESIDISFLSTARAGTVIVRASQLQRALNALEVGMKLVERDL